MGRTERREPRLAAGFLQNPKLPFAFFLNISLHSADSHRRSPRLVIEIFVPFYDRLSCCVRCVLVAQPFRQPLEQMTDDYSAVRQILLALFSPRAGRFILALISSWGVWAPPSQACRFMQDLVKRRGWNGIPR